MAVTTAIERTIEKGGQLSIVGPRGCGRSHVLEAVEQGLDERSAPCVWLSALSEQPWAAIEDALADPSLPGAPLPLPRRSSPERMAQAAARSLRARAQGRLRVLVDDLHRLDPGSARVVAALCRLNEVDLFIAGPQAHELASATLTLDPWPIAAVESWLGDLFPGTTPNRALVELLLGTGRGRPGRMVALLEQAVVDGLLDGRSGRLLRPAAELPRLRIEPVAGLPLADDPRDLGALLSLAATVLPAQCLSAIIGWPQHRVDAAISILKEHRLVRIGPAGVRCQGPEARVRLAPTRSELRRLHRALLSWQVERGIAPARRIPHLVGAGVAEQVRRHGAATLADLEARDAQAALQVAPALLALASEADLVAVCVRALGRDGHQGEALSLGERAVERGGQLAGLARIHAELSRLHLEHLGDPAAARASVRAARRVLGGEPPPLCLLEVESLVHLQAGQVSQALATARQGVSYPEPRAEAARFDRESWLMLRVLEARALAAGGRLEAALGRLEATPPEAGSPDRELLLQERAALLLKGGQLLAAASAYETLARLDLLSVGADHVRWLDEAATARYHGGDRQGAIESWTRALSLAHRALLGTEQARIQATLCSVLREVCRFEEAARFGQEAFESASAYGVLDDALSAAMAMGDLRMVTGPLDEAATWFGRAAHLALRHRLDRASARLARRWAELAVRREDPHAMDAVREAVRVNSHPELVRDASRSTALKALLLARLGQLEQLDATLDRAIAPLVKAGSARTLAEVRLWAAEARLAAGQPDLALEEAARAVVWADEVGHTLFRNRADELSASARAQIRRASQPGQRGSATLAAELERLLEVAVALGRERDLSALLGRVAEAAMHFVQADRSFVILAGEAGSWQVAAARSRDAEDPGRPSTSVVQTVLARGREVIVSDVAERKDLRTQDSIVHLRLRSAMCVPLIEGDRTLGAIYVDSRCTSRQEITRSARLLRALAGQSAVAVTNARLLAEARARAERAAEIAHDIRSPLSSIAMAAGELGSVEELPDWTREALSLMGEQASRVMSMAHRFLEDRPGQQKLLDLAQRAERLASMAARDARHGGRSVTFQANGYALVQGDPDELDRAIANLLGNALQHTPPGTAIEVRVHGASDGVLLTVRDHGPGIASELLPRLFERGSRSDRTGGYGLGLAIARRIVEDAGGSISAANHPEGGAEFRLLFRTVQRREARDSLS